MTPTDIVRPSIVGEEISANDEWGLTERDEQGTEAPPDKCIKYFRSRDTIWDLLDQREIPHRDDTSKPNDNRR